MKVKHAALVEALTGRFDDHHGELARILLDQYDALTGRVDQLTAQIDQLTARIEDLVAALPEAWASTPTAPPGPGSAPAPPPGYRRAAGAGRHRTAG